MSEDIERLSRKRRIMLATYGVAFLGLQAILFEPLNDPAMTWRPVDWALAAGFVGWSVTLLYVLATGGLLFRGRSAETRAAMNDELTQANRNAGYRAGYWAMLAVAAVLYVLSQIFDLSTQECLKLVFAIGVAMPACRFAGLEQKQGG